MELSKRTAEVHVPDGATDADPQQAADLHVAPASRRRQEVAEALARTTHLAVGAHQDDLEIMALEGILACFGKPDAWFTGVIVTSGAGSPRDGLYEAYTDEQMQAVRRTEQQKAAFVGEYGAVVFLDHSSAEVKDPANRCPVTDLAQVLLAARPSVVYTHNLADKHPTHVAVALRLIEAARSLPPEARPKRLLGCEVWRDLDWMCDTDKVVFRLDAHENIAASLVGVFDSQIAGGKRYDLATMGRRRAHATYLESHATDAAQLVNFGMDLTPLLSDAGPSPSELVAAHIERFAEDVRATLVKLA
ncbi:MAG: PIG-L family deacetylase [Armatimonadetes bacterium]|nr:PIG-L family deacetylase [Armatimonadota bacterium]